MNITSASLQAAYQSASYTNSMFSVSGSYLEITGNLSSVKGSSDNLDVSETAKKLLERIKELDVFKIIYPNGDVSKQYKSLDEVESDFNQDFMNFGDLFGKMTSMLGINAAGLTMGLNGAGGVDVQGEGNAAQKVQGAFNGSSTMVSRFAVMAARAALVDARGTLDGFDSAYSLDPVEAIKKNIDALKERLLGFRTVADDSELSYGFIREFSASIQFSSTTVSYAAGKTDGASTEEETETETPVADPVEAA